MLEQQTDLINKDKGRSALCAVLRDTVEDAVKYNEHTDQLELLAEVENVIADQAVLCIHIRRLRKGIQRTVGEQLKRESDFLCFGFRLLHQLCTEVTQGRDRTGIIALLIITVYRSRTAVDDRLLNCAQACRTDELLAQRHDELGFEDNGVRAVAVLDAHIHRIDMVPRGSRNVDDLTVHRPYKRRILSLRVDDDNIAVHRQL